MACAAASALMMGCGGGADPASTQPVTTSQGAEIRVPAEWEPQAAVWLQWPRSYESAYEKGLAQVVATIVRYEDVHVLVHDERTQRAAEAALERHGGLAGDVIGGGETPEGFRIRWHRVKNDNAWMRDNGPRYVVADGELRIQNWEFDGWGGGFGPGVRHGHDNAVPNWVGDQLGLAVDPVPIVHERGDLEFNGAGTVILNWSVIGDPERNRGMTRGEAEAAMLEYFGAERAILIEGAPTGDLTGGHVDGIARFVDAERVVVADCSPGGVCVPGDRDDQIYDSAASQLEEAGLEVVRWPFAATVSFDGLRFDTNYLNWLVGNGFVITVGFGHPEADAEAKSRLEEWFPGRDVYVIEMLESWAEGGGVHCHTNDQPAARGLP